MTYTETLLEENYEYISPFRCERAVAYSEKRERIGIIDPAGRTVFAYRPNRQSSPGTVRHSGEYSEGLVSFLGENGKIGYLDTEGNTVLPCRYEKAGMFIDGLACVMLDGRHGMIDKNGNFVIPPVYDRIGTDTFNAEFSEDRLFVCRDGKAGYINREGETVIPFTLDYPLTPMPVFTDPEFGDGLAAVSRNGKAIYIDRTGNEVLPVPEGCYIAGKFHDGLTYISYPRGRKSSYARLMRRDGSWLLPPEFDFQGTHWGKRLQFIKGKKHAFADRLGNIVFETDCDFVHDFVYGYTPLERTWAQKNGRWGVIDADGNTVLPFAWDYFEIWPCGGGLYCVTDKKKHGCIDRDGNTVVPMEYDSYIHFWYGKYAIVKKNGQWATLKLEGAYT